MPDIDTTVTSDDVRALLAPVTTKPNSVNIPVDPAVMQEVAGEGSSETPKPAIHVPGDPTFDIEQQTIDESIRWTLTLPSIGTVTVTDTEKLDYLKKFNFDEPIEWQINIEHMNFNAGFRARTEYEQKVIWEALQTLRDAKYVQEPGVGVTMLQQCSAAVMICSIQGRQFPVDGPRLKFVSGEKPIKDHAEELLEYVRRHIDPLPSTKWNIIVHALRIFNAKLTLCDNNIANESFWKPAS